MSRMFEDTNTSHITMEEWDALKTITKSERAGLLATQLLKAMSEMDDKAPSFFLTIIPQIVKIQIDKATNRVHDMQGWVQLLGRTLTIEKIKTGKDKGTPRFLTKKFKEFLEISAWDMLVYIYNFTNFQEYHHKHELGVYTNPVTASKLCPQDELAKAYILRFCKFLDDMKTTKIEKLVSSMIFEQYPNMKEFINWCYNNRSKWDDISATTKFTKGKKNG